MSNARLPREHTGKPSARNLRAFSSAVRSRDSMVQVRPGKWKKEIFRRVGYKSLDENLLPRTLTRCATYFRSPLGFSRSLEISFSITIRKEIDRAYCFSAGSKDDRVIRIWIYYCWLVARDTHPTFPDETNQSTIHRWMRTSQQFIFLERW